MVKREVLWRCIKCRKKNRTNKKSLEKSLKPESASGPREISIKCKRCKTPNRFRVKGLFSSSEVFSLAPLYARDTPGSRGRFIASRDLDARKQKIWRSVSLGSLETMLRELTDEPEDRLEERVSHATEALDQSKNMHEAAKAGFPEINEALDKRLRTLGSLVSSSTFPPTLEHRQVKAAIYDHIKLEWGCDTWKEFAKKRAKVKSRIRYHSGFPKARKMALERDGHKCVATGATLDLEVHHIDGDCTNSELYNLVTIHKKIHRMITGTGADPETRGVKAILKWLRSNGYDNARIKSKRCNCWICKGRINHRLVPGEWTPNTPPVNEIV